MIVHVVFDGPPGPVAGRFIEVETPDGKSLSVGRWIEREDGYWALEIDVRDTERPSIIPGDHPETRKLAAMMREDTERHEHVPEHKGDFSACMRCGEMPDHPIHRMMRGGHVYDHDLNTGIWTCQCGYTTDDPDAIEAHREDTERDAWQVVGEEIGRAKREDTERPDEPPGHSR